MKKILYTLLLCSALLFLLLNPGKGFEAASSGLLLWFDTLVPTLLPMMILSALLVKSGLTATLAKPLHLLTGRLLHLSASGTYAMMIGFLCGYPMGARALADLRGEQQITREEACYLVLFCNNASPAFTLGYLIQKHLRHPAFTVPTLCIVYLSPLLYGMFTNPGYRKRAAASSLDFTKKTSATAPTFAMIDVSITQSIQNITKLGGYIILFSIFTAMIGLLPDTLLAAKALAIGLTEITTGIHHICGAAFPWKQKYLMLIAVTVFGGLCSAGQSQAMLKEIGVPLRRYLRAKLAITAIALLLTACFLH